MVRAEIPTSMPTMRATTTRALARPCTSWWVLASRAALTGARASPKPKPHSTSGMFEEKLSRVSSCQVVIQPKPPAAQAMPTAVTTPDGTWRVR